jgi:hypothetical protein
VIVASAEQKMSFASPLWLVRKHPVQSEPETETETESRGRSQNEAKTEINPNPKLKLELKSEAILKPIVREEDSEKRW